MMMDTFKNLVKRVVFKCPADKFRYELNNSEDRLNILKYIYSNRYNFYKSHDPGCFGEKPYNREIFFATDKYKDKNFYVIYEYKNIIFDRKNF